MEKSAENKTPILYLKFAFISLFAVYIVSFVYIFHIHYAQKTPLSDGERLFSEIQFYQQEDAGPHEELTQDNLHYSSGGSHVRRMREGWR